MDQTCSILLHRGVCKCLQNLYEEVLFTVALLWVVLQCAEQGSLSQWLSACPH